MRKKTVIILTFLCISLVTRVRGIEAYLSYCTFYSPVDGPYIETYISFDARSVKWVQKENNKYGATLQILILFKNDSIIQNYKKYNFSAPEIDDTTNIDFNFIDQQRFALNNGKYDFQIYIRDTNSKVNDEIYYEAPIEISYSDKKINISGIELIDSYLRTDETNVLTKNGYKIIPYIAAYYPKEVSKIKFYSEIYNTSDVFGDDYKYLITMYIKSFTSGLPVNDFYFVRKSVSNKVNVLLNEIDISLLPSGNYFLVIEVRNQNNEIMATNEVFFQRNNPSVAMKLSDIKDINISNTFVSNFNNQDTLREFILCLSPVSSENERQFAANIIKNNDLKGMQQYFLNFWITRDSQNPKQAWNNYYNMVKAVNKEFGTRIKKGWETDRGRVYLQYGPPNSRQEVANEPNAYPYEIWHYYSLNEKQRNKRFVFYSPDFVTGDYELLHSDAIGEIYDPLWERKLNRDNILYNFDEKNYNSHWGSRAKELYDHPR